MSVPSSHEKNHFSFVNFKYFKFEVKFKFSVRVTIIDKVPNSFLYLISSM